MLQAAFVPSRANADALSSELPLTAPATTRGGHAQEPAAAPPLTSEPNEPQSRDADGKVAVSSSQASQDAGTHGHAPRVLYPASARARTTLQKGLEERGFEVMRLNTYDTVAVLEVSDAQRREALGCDVVSIASPSALKAWVQLVGLERVQQMYVACIGSTSGEAALKLGLDKDKVFWAESPGMEGFLASVMSAVVCAQRQPTPAG